MPVDRDVAKKLPITIAFGGSAAGWAREELGLELAPAFGGEQGSWLDGWAAEQARIRVLTCEAFASELEELVAKGYDRPALSLQFFVYADQETGLRLRLGSPE